LTLLFISQDTFYLIGGIISSLAKDFNSHYGMNLLQKMADLNKVKITSSVLASSLNYIVYSMNEYPFLGNLFSRLFLATHRSRFGQEFDLNYYILLRDLYTNYGEIHLIHAKLTTAFSQMIEFYVHRFMDSFLEVYVTSNAFLDD
jgi:hypothetical protein